MWELTRLCCEMYIWKGALTSKTWMHLVCACVATTLKNKKVIALKKFWEIIVHVYTARCTAEQLSLTCGYADFISQLSEYKKKKKRFLHCGAAVWKWFGSSHNEKHFTVFCQYVNESSLEIDCNKIQYVSRGKKTDVKGWQTLSISCLTCFEKWILIFKKILKVGTVYQKTEKVVQLKTL